LDVRDVEKVALTAEGLATRKPTRRRRKGPFIQFLPLAWIARADQLPGRARSVGLCLWYIAGLSRSQTVSFRLRLMSQFGVSPKAARRGLRALEKAGLVSINQKPGCNPLVTLRDVEGES
jgi:hypothetical protein